MIHRFVAAGIAIAAAALVFAVTVDGGPGPIPECNGEQATRVLVEFGHEADYAAWAAQGVRVQTNLDNVLKGTPGHDVLVSLVETQTGGFYNKAHYQSQKINPATAGDFMCSYLVGSDDAYYATPGYSDFIFDADGGDNYFLGGCRLEGEGSPGDRGCDVMISEGHAGSNDDGRDQVWGGFVPKGRVQVFTEGIAWAHNYVGAGPGKVIIHGGGCEVRSGGSFVDCVGNVPAGGDHVHPCPVGQISPTFLPDGRPFASHGLVLDGIEYVGDESEFTDDPNDPCAYQQKTL